MSETPKSTSSPAVTEYFTGLASNYADHRPTYSPAAMDWMLTGIPRPLTAADIGCGTGISTALLVDRNVNVIGIDPNADMLAEARRRTPPSLAVEFRVGSGERTGVPDGGVDLVLCAQSFHWFDAVAALREFHRVIRPEGRLALMWNVKDNRDPFSAQFIRISDRAQADAAARGLFVPSDRDADPTLGGFFRHPRQRRFVNMQWLNLDGVLGRARSASYFPKSGPLRDELERELKTLFRTHQQNERVGLLHYTEVTLADRA